MPRHIYGHPKKKFGVPMQVRLGCAKVCICIHPNGGYNFKLVFYPPTDQIKKYLAKREHVGSSSKYILKCI